MLEKLRLGYVKTYVQFAKQGGWGYMSPPVKIAVSPAKKKFVLGRMPKRPPRHKHLKKLNVFYINITTRQQFFIRVSETTKNMLKQRFPDFFQIIFESMN